MALATYSDLKTAVASWLSRADLTSTIPDFITLAHAQLMRDLRGHPRLQIRNTSFAVSAEYVAVPSDFMEWIDGYMNTNPRQHLEFLTPAQATQFDPDAATGIPGYVTIVGSSTNVQNFRFTPPPDSASYTATIEYYGRLTAMSNNSDTNWILTNHPDCYLYGSLLQARGYIMDDPRLQTWQAMYQASVGSVTHEGKRSRWSGQSMMVRAG